MCDRSHTVLAYAHVGFFSCLPHISGKQSFHDNRLFIFHAFVALKLLVSLIGRLAACSARINIDRQTDRWTDRPSTITLAVHARRGLIGERERANLVVRSSGILYILCRRRRTSCKCALNNFQIFTHFHTRCLSRYAPIDLASPRTLLHSVACAATFGD